jgi:anti-anti-sigma factor
MNQYTGECVVSTAFTTAGAVVKVVGEVDLLTVQPVESQVIAQIDAATDLLILDLTGVSFFGSAGLAMLVAAKRRAASRGVRLSLIADHRAVVRPLETGGLLEHFDLHPTPESASLSR